MLASLRDRKYPLFAEAQKNRHIGYNQTLDMIQDLEAKGEIFVIRPPESIPVGRMEKDPNKVQAAYDMGHKCALDYMSDLKRFLKNCREI